MLKAQTDNKLLSVSSLILGKENCMLFSIVSFFFYIHKIGDHLTWSVYHGLLCFTLLIMCLTELLDSD